MLVFKFGGASVKNADAVRNIATILSNYKAPIIVVVSAMGKTTNALERLIESYYKADSNMLNALQEVKTYHYNIADSLFTTKNLKIFKDLDRTFEELERLLHRQPSMNFDYEYDQIVSYGEILSTLIVSAFLNDSGVTNSWIDIRNCLKTDSTFRDAKVDFELSAQLIDKTFNFEKDKIYVTQGFIGSDINNLATTLGREGSDYSAAVIAYLMNAEKVVIWKDVPGVLNADPKYFDETVKLDKLSYLDAIELTYYGASVIHPKTIKPLQNKNIKLYVKSFLDPANEGTVIGDNSYDSLIPSFIFKVDQVLIHISPTDFSFIAEDNLKIIFGLFAKHNINVNLMQNSAVSFKVCVNNDKMRLPKLADEMRKTFSVSFETGLELITIRYYDEATIGRVMHGKQLLLEQKNSKTIQMVVKNI
jgi:aspartate kinase